jgi:hypothetical protein
MQPAPSSGTVSYTVYCTHLLRWALVRWFLTKISNLIDVAKVQSIRFSRSLNSIILGRQIEHPPSSPNLEDDQLGAQISEGKFFCH